MVKVKYINHVYGKNGLEYDQEKNIKGEVIEENNISLTVKRGKFSYYILKESILSMEEIER